MLNIDEIIHNAIEMCGLDIDGLVQEAVTTKLDEICSKAKIKNAIQDCILYTVENKEDEIEDKVSDAISDYVEEVVDEYIS